MGSGRKQHVLAAGIAAIVAGTSWAQSQVEHLWHYESASSQANWRTVAIGASGSQVVSNPEGGSGSVALFAAALAPSTPVIWADNTSAQAGAGIVRAAADSDQYATLFFEATGAGANVQYVPKLSLRRSSQPVSLWTKTFAPITSGLVGLPYGLFVSEQGTRIVAWWYDSAQTKTYWAGYSESGAAQFAVSMVTYLPPQASAADSELTRFVLGFPTLTLVMDAGSGALVKSLYSTAGLPTKAIGIAAHGDIVVVGNTTGTLDVFRSAAAPLGFAYTIPAFSDHMPSSAAISANGQTLVLGSRSSADPQAHLVRFFDLGPSQATARGSQGFHASGILASLITDLAVSRNGEVVAVSTTGDQNDLLPSLLAFRRESTGYVANFSTTLPGTVYDLDLSPDGRVLAAASSTMHYMQSTQTGVVDAFDLGGDISVRGVPHGGSNVVVEQKAGAGLPCILLVSDALAPTPTVFAGMGSLLLATPVRIATAVADAAGVARYDFSLPAGSSYWGHTYYTQAMSLIERRLTKNYAPVTVVP